MMQTYTLENVGSLFDRMRVEFPAAAVRGLQSCALELVRDIKSKIIAESGLGTGRGRYKAAWRAEPLPDGAMVLNSTNYAAVIEYGRRPGAAIGWNMVAGILDWLRMRDRSRATWEHAWALARDIQNRGMWMDKGPGMRILERATVDLQERVAKHIRAELDRL
jgi:hypothetical protein